MIPRYSRPAMVGHLVARDAFRIWFEIEAHATRGAGRRSAWFRRKRRATIWEKGSAATFDVDRIDEIERVTKHDVIAFLTHLAEHRRRRSPLRPSGHDLVGRARHLLRRAAHARGRPAARRSRRAAGGAEAARLRAQDDADHRPLARHPCRADDLRAEARLRLCGVRPGAGAARRCARRRSRPARSPARSAPSPTSIRASRHMWRPRWGSTPEPVSTQVIPRDRHADVLRDARRHRLLDRAARDRDPSPAAHRGAGGRGVLLRRARRAPRPCRTSATRCCPRT